MTRDEFKLVQAWVQAERNRMTVSEAHTCSDELFEAERLEREARKAVAQCVEDWGHD